MKCIREKNGEVIRVSNEDAKRLVEKGQGVYVPKSKWKENRNSGEK